MASHSIRGREGEHEKLALERNACRCDRVARRGVRICTRKRTRSDVHPGYAERTVSVRDKWNRFPPASGVTTQSLFTRSGYRIFDGDGTGTSIATTSINGKIQDPDIHSDLSYTVNADCTGTVEVLAVGATVEIFIAPNGDDMTVIATDKGHVEAFRSWRVGPE